MTVPDEPIYDPSDLATTLLASVTALLRTPQLKQGLHDLLSIYGITSMSGEVLGNQHMQIQSLAEAMAMFLGRLLEHERRSVTIIDLLQKIIDTSADPSVAAALAALQAQANAPDDIAARARTLLRIAQPAANRADLADAVATAQTLRADAAATPPAESRRTPAPVTDAQALRTQATETAETAAATAAEAATQTLKAAAAETAAAEAEAAGA